MKFQNYQSALISYIESLEEDGEEALEFLNSLMFVEGDYYGAYQCDICGHPLKYAMVIDAVYIERVCITAAPDNNLFIGTTCFDKLTKLAWLKKKMTHQYDEWKKAMDALKTGDKATYNGIMLTVKEAKRQLREERERAQGEAAEKSYQARKELHEHLLKSDACYAYLFNKFGFTSKDKTDDEARNFYAHAYAGIQTDNDFLTDLFEKAQMQKNGLSEKQRYWFEKLADETKVGNKQDPKYKEILQVLAEKVRLSSFDADFIESMYQQSKTKPLSEKQMQVVDKLAHKYRKQIEGVTQ